MEIEKLYEEYIGKYKDSDKPLIITEGKTDWKHLKNAWDKKFKFQYSNIDFDFLDYEDEIDIGDSELATMVRTYSKVKQPKKMIMIFDRDQVGKNGKKDVKKLFNKDTPFNNHRNNVYSLFIPIVGNLEEVCIEFYYKQEEVKNAWYKKDDWINKKRLFYGSEFDEKTQKSLCDKYKTDKPYPKALDILDGDNKKKVYHVEDNEEYINNIALSKNDFAENVYHDVKGFDNFNIDNFKKIFDIIEKIIKD
jgi:5S rRNA maturation endonuclease (ribonuclease M5)